MKIYLVLIFGSILFILLLKISYNRNNPQESYQTLNVFGLILDGEKIVQLLKRIAVKKINKC